MLSVSCKELALRESWQSRQALTERVYAALTNSSLPYSFQQGLGQARPNKKLSQRGKNFQELKICGHGTILALSFFAVFRNFHISICSQIVDKLRLTRYYKGNPNILPRRCNHDRHNLRPLFFRQPARSVH